MNNFSFSSNNELDSSNYYFEYGEILTQEISTGLKLDAGFKKSIISDYSIFTDFRVSNDLFGFNLGIFTSFLNDSSKILTPGLNYGLDFIIPGIIVVNLDLNNTIPNTSPLETGVSINNYNVKIGFYMGEAIISGNMESESCTKGDILTSTSTINTKYFVNLDLFNKYAKYRISLDIGWNQLSRATSNLISDSGTLKEDSLLKKEAGSLYFNTDFTVLASDTVNINTGILLHLVKFPIKDVDSFSDDEFNWGMNVGVTLKL